MKNQDFESFIAQNLRALGHNVTVLTARHGKLPGYSIESGIVVRRIRCIRNRVDRSNLFEMLTFMLAALFSLPFILGRDRPDGLIIFFSLPSGPLGLVAKIFFRTPYVISLRGGDAPGLVPELSLLHKVVAPLRRLVLKHAVAVVANSEALRKFSEAQDRHPVRVIPNGVDTEVFQPTRLTSPRSDGRLRILFVGRFREQKNLEFLLRELARLPIGSYELHLVGDGQQGKRFRDLAERLGIAKSIVWHGWLPRSALPGMYQSADCLVNPSFYEGMPNVVLEAMASGLPVIASKVPGHDALVVDGETGFLFDLQEPDRLLSALKRMKDVDLCRRMGANGRVRVVAEFLWSKAADAYVRLFLHETA